MPIFSAARILSARLKPDFGFAAAKTVGSLTLDVDFLRLNFFAANFRPGVF